jgi:hypothetical protein
MKMRIMINKIIPMALAAATLLTLVAGAQAQAVRSAVPPASAASMGQPRPSGAKLHQLLAACNKKVDDAGLAGEARKKAMHDCLQAP